MNQRKVEPTSHQTGIEIHHEHCPLNDLSQLDDLLPQTIIRPPDDSLVDVPLLASSSSWLTSPPISIWFFFTFKKLPIFSSILDINKHKQGLPFTLNPKMPNEHLLLGQSKWQPLLVFVYVQVGIEGCHSLSTQKCQMNICYLNRVNGNPCFKLELRVAIHSRPKNAKCFCLNKVQRIISTYPARAKAPASAWAAQKHQQQEQQEQQVQEHQQHPYRPACPRRLQLPGQPSCLLHFTHPRCPSWHYINPGLPNRGVPNWLRFWTNDAKPNLNDLTPFPSYYIKPPIQGCHLTYP